MQPTEERAAGLWSLENVLFPVPVAKLQPTLLFYIRHDARLCKCKRLSSCSAPHRPFPLQLLSRRA